MASINQCLDQIDEVFGAADDPAAAYLIRSRLRRSMLSCMRYVAEACGADKPSVPGAFVSPPGADGDQIRVLRLCARIHAIAGELCRPSESFDLRWRDGWAGLSVELKQLRAVLTNMPAEVRN
jgi:hypothetical protein